MRLLIRVLASLLFLTTYAAADNDQPAAGFNPSQIRAYGRVEIMRLPEGNIDLVAKLDTGADTSSIGIIESETFEKDGDKWVRFSIEGEGGYVAEFERKVDRTVKIKNRPEGENERLVVTLEVCVGDVVEFVEVNLADRSEFSTAALVGASFLQNGILVNSAAEFTTQPDCK